MSSLYLVDQLGNHLLRSGTFNKPAVVWVRLWTTLPDSAGNGGVEVSAAATGYSPIQYGPGDTYWGTDGYGQFFNLATVQYGQPSANWGGVVGVTLHTAQTGGNMIDRKAFTSPVSVVSGGQSIAFAPGDLRFVFT